jgi:putative type II/III system pilus formation protein
MTLHLSTVCKPMLRALAGSAALAALTAVAQADEIQVPLDQVRTVAFEKPVKTVYIGNPVIADITVIDSTHVFILGKSFGTTNIVTLDASGHETLNEQIIVTDRPGIAVTVQRGIARTTMMCTVEHCEAAPAPGDDATSNIQRLGQPPHDALTAQANGEEGSGTKAAAGNK